MAERWMAERSSFPADGNCAALGHFSAINFSAQNNTFRTWWRNRPDEVALNDPALERGLPEAELEAVEFQDLADLIPDLLEIKNQENLPLTFRVRIELGDTHKAPSAEAATAVNKLLESAKKGFKL